MAALKEEMEKSLRRRCRRRLKIHLREVAVIEQALQQVYLLVDGQMPDFLAVCGHELDEVGVETRPCNRGEKAIGPVGSISRCKRSR